MSQLTEIKPSLACYSLAEAAVAVEIDGEESNVSLKEAWINLGNQLEIEGILTDQICSTASKLLVETKCKKTKIPKEEIKMGGYFYRVYQSQDWTNQFYARRNISTESVPLGEQENSSISNFESENKQTISAIDVMMEFLKSEKQFLKHNSHDGKIPENILRENILTMKSAITHANQRFNNKLKIAPSHYSILFKQFLESMSSHLSVPFYLHVRKKETFTAKQAGKIIRANVKDMPYRYEPKDEDETEACGFSGVPCPNCGNFRTEVTMRIETYEAEEKGKKVQKSRGIRQVHCFKEDEDYDAPRVALPANEISESDWQ